MKGSDCAPKPARPIPIDEPPARPTLEVVPSLERFHAASHGLPIDDGRSHIGQNICGAGVSGVDVTRAAGLVPIGNVGMVKLLVAVRPSQLIDFRLQCGLVRLEPINFCLHHRDALELSTQIRAILFDLLTNALTRCFRPIPRPLDVVKFAFQLIDPCRQLFDLSRERGVWATRARRTIAA